jgi:hypothetical protein
VDRGADGLLTGLLTGVTMAVVAMAVAATVWRRWAADAPTVQVRRVSALAWARTALRLLRVRRRAPA